MELGMIGLGRMGANMTERLLRGGHQVVSYDRDPEAVRRIVKKGAKGVHSIEELISSLSPRRAIWLMIPAGKIIDEALENLLPLVEKNSIIIDGGNSYYRDTVQRAEWLRKKGIYYVDAGTSGGIWGLSEGYSLMIGGDEEPINYLKSIFETLAPSPDRGWARVGPSGAGHFVKMVHNGIEYGLMQAYSEGFALLKRKTEFNLDLHLISEVWRHGSVIRSWLLDLLSEALNENPDLKDIAPYVVDSGEGRWTVQEALDQNLAMPVITLSLLQRFASREKDNFSSKILAVLRDRFGGHGVKRKENS